MLESPTRLRRFAGLGLLLRSTPCSMSFEEYSCPPTTYLMLANQFRRAMRLEAGPNSTSACTCVQLFGHWADSFSPQLADLHKLGPEVAMRIAV